MKKELLMTPGPSQVPHEVAIAGAAPMMHHRSSDFKGIYKKLIAGMKQVFATQGDVFILSSSGTGAMEAAIVNTLCIGDRVVVCNTGKFGERFTNICRAYGIEVIEIVKEWGEAVEPEDVKNVLESEKDIRAVMMQQNETSTGVLNPVEKIGPMVDEYGALTIVDAISALGGCEMKQDEWKLDLVCAGSQKALMLPPGMAFLGVRGEKAWKACDRSTLPNFYFNINKYKKIFDKSGDTPFTTPVSLCLSLEASLKMLMDEGLQNVYARHEKLASAARAGVEALGLEQFSKRPSSVVTTFKVPAGLDGNELVKIAREKYGVRVSGGQEPFKGKIVRIAHMGYATGHDIILALSACEMALADLGFSVTPGAAVKAVGEVLRNEA